MNSKETETEDCGASHCSSKPLARQFSNLQCSIGFANVYPFHFFIFASSEAKWSPSAANRFIDVHFETSSVRGTTPWSFTVTKDKNPLSPILIRFKQDLQFNGLEERSQESYGRAVRKFSEFLKREPDTASEDDLRSYLLFIKNDLHWEASTINVAQQGLKKFFRITCPQTWPTLKLLRVRGELKLPVVITIGEIHTFLKLIDKPSMLCFFTVVYTLGLRLQEALNLQVADIDSKRMMVHIHRGKGAKDRMVPLPDSTLLALREYYKTHRNKKWIFPAEGKNHSQAATADKPMSDSSVQGVIKAVLKQLNWDNRGISTHTLRHCYATHLLEAGISLKLIQKYLGHAFLTTTMIYLHVTTVGEENAIAKINALMKKKS